MPAPETTVLTDLTDRLSRALAQNGPGADPKAHADLAAAVSYAGKMFSRDFGLYRDAVERIGFGGLGRVLDAGAGAGHWSLALAQDNHEVVAADLSRYYTQICGLAAQNFPNGHRVKAVTCQAHRLPYPDRHFDGVLCHSMLMYDYHDRVLEEFARVLKPGGLLYLGYSGPGWYLGYLLRDGVVGGNQGRMVSGYRVLANRGRFCRGLLPAGDPWISLGQAELTGLLASKGFVMERRPGVADGHGSFLGLEGVFDLLLSHRPHTVAKPPAGGERLEAWLQRRLALGDASSALRALDSHRGGELEPARAALHRAHAHLIAGRLEQARTALAGLDSSSPEATLARAKWSQAAGDLGGAIRRYRQLGEGAKFPEAPWLLAQALLDAGDWQQAEPIFQGLLERDPGSLAVWNGLWGCSLVAGNRDGLLAWAKRFFEFLSQNGGPGPAAEARDLARRLPPTGQSQS